MNIRGPDAATISAVATPSNRKLSRFGTRLRDAVERSPRYATRAEFLADADMSRTHLYKCEYGDAEPGMAHLTYWAQLLNVDRGWLASGLSGLGQRLGVFINNRDVFFAHPQVDAELAEAVLDHGALPDDLSLMAWAQILGQDYLWLKGGPGARGSGPGAYALSRSATVRQALLDDPKRVKSGADALGEERASVAAFRDGDDAALTRDQIDTLFAEFDLVEPSLARDRALTVSSAPEPANLREYMAKLRAGKAMKRTADTDPKAQSLLDALRVVVNFTGDMPAPEDWHTVRRALEQGEKVRRK